MTVLLVSPFAPYRDGIATYAVQELRQLRERGVDVEVLSPEPSAARFHLQMGHAAGMARLVKRASEFERVILQFGPEHVFGRCRTAPERLAVWGGLLALARNRPLDLRIHEINYGPLKNLAVERRVARLALEAADRVTVHTDAEREALLEILGKDLAVEVIDHGSDFVPATQMSKTEARTELGLDQGRHIFVCIGFLQHHKGFDLAIDALEELNGTDIGGTDVRNVAELHIVGSARVDHPDINKYVGRLANRCAQLPNAFLHQRFVSDVEFDLWLRAADTVVLPYREIWSSSVTERARLFDVPIIASGLPQLRDQCPPGTAHADGAHELAAAMSDAVHADGGIPAEPATTSLVLSEPTGWVVDRRAPDRLAIQVQVEARGRALTALGGDPSTGSPGAVDRMLALGPLPRPSTASGRRGVSTVKRVVARLVGWQVEPLAQRIEELQRATTEALAVLEARSEAIDLAETDSSETPLQIEEQVS